MMKLFCVNTYKLWRYGTDPYLTDDPTVETDGDGLCDYTEVRGLVTRYVMDVGDKGHRFFRSYEEFREEYEEGLWDRRFTYFTNPLNPDTDFDGQIDSKDLIPKDYDMNGDGRINHVSLVDPTSDYYVERIAWAANHDPWLDRDASGNLIGSYDMSGDGMWNDDPDNKDLSRDGMPTSYEMEYGVANGGWQHPYLYNARYALLIASGSSSKGGFFPAFWSGTTEAYYKLVDDYHYREENVYLMSSRWHVKTESGSYEWMGHNSTTNDIVDGECMWKTDQNFDIKDAIITIGQQTTKNDYIYIQIYSHGWSGFFVGRDPEDPKWSETIRFKDVFNEINMSWGGTVEYGRKYARASIVISTCSSEWGAKMFTLGENRIGISSTEHEKEAYLQINSEREKCLFLQESREGIHYGIYTDYTEHDGFLRGLGNINVPQSIDYAYQQGYNAATKNYIHWFTGGVITDRRTWPQIFNEDLSSSTYL